MKIIIDEKQIEIMKTFKKLSKAYKSGKTITIKFGKEIIKGVVKSLSPSQITFESEGNVFGFAIKFISVIK